MGFLVAILVFAATALTATHIDHLHEQNAELHQKVQVMEAQEDGVNLQLDGVPVRNLGDEK